MTYLPIFDDFAHKVARVPRDRVGPDAFAAQTEQRHEEVGHWQVQDHGAQGRSVRVSNDGADGDDVGHQRHNWHGCQDQSPD